MWKEAVVANLKYLLSRHFSGRTEETRDRSRTDGVPANAGSGHRQRTHHRRYGVSRLCR
jgi:hypothetical protein